MRAKVAENKLSRIEPLPGLNSRQIVACIVLRNCQAGVNQGRVGALPDEAGL